MLSILGLQCWKLNRWLHSLKASLRCLQESLQSYSLEFLFLRWWVFGLRRWKFEGSQMSVKGGYVVCEGGFYPWRHLAWKFCLEDFDQMICAVVERAISLTMILLTSDAGVLCLPRESTVKNQKCWLWLSDKTEERMTEMGYCTGLDTTNWRECSRPSC